MVMTATDFAQKWASNRRTERAASQEHFIDLCRMLGEPTPNEADPTGRWYAFEKGAERLDGGDGFADVWKKDHFAWEYKGKRKDLGAAYRQLALYREALDNPPGLVVCDMDRFEIHTNFTSTPTRVITFNLEDLRNRPEEPLRTLRALMREPEKLRPGTNNAQITEEAASQFAELAERLRKRGHRPLQVARFLNRILFCFFAEDAGPLPSGIVVRILQGARRDPEATSQQLKTLFGRMTTKGGGFFGPEHIDWFNGGLFTDDAVLPLLGEDVEVIERVAALDWSSVEPTILGTLFERGLDPAKRAQLGAHYTDIESIRRVLDPVLLRPLRKEFEHMKDTVERALARGKRPTARAKGRDNPNRIYRAFLKRLADVRVLDPACGSGNFLYVALRELKFLEKEAIVWATTALRMTQEIPGVGPQVLHGIEVNEYAAELARVTIWIGEIQWMIDNGFGYRTNPILRHLDNIECRDAILEIRDGAPAVPEWPAAEFIVGNPPFLGAGARMREALGDPYLRNLRAAWEGRVSAGSDLACFWHEKAREMIQSRRAKRAGLLATQSIRNGANRGVLDRIKTSGEIFEAWRDEPWILDGADVRVSIVCQDDGTETVRRLDGHLAPAIFSDLGAGKVDLTRRSTLDENSGIAFAGAKKHGQFELTADEAAGLLSAGPNTNGLPNSDVVVPWSNSRMLVGMPWVRKYIIDFAQKDEEAAALFEAPFARVRRLVYPERQRNNRSAYRDRWWLFGEARPGMRKALAGLDRFIVTPETSRRRIFEWARAPLLPDNKLIVIARSDDYAFGVLHSRIHEVWALRMSRRHGVGNDPVYAPEFTFDTFPFPWPLHKPATDLTNSQRAASAEIASAASHLSAIRLRWLHPPELVDWVDDLNKMWPQIAVAKNPGDEKGTKELKARTLSKLYAGRPDWLRLAHEKLDAAVAAAYGWPSDLADDEILERLLELNQQRAAAGSVPSTQRGPRKRSPSTEVRPPLPILRVGKRKEARAAPSPKRTRPRRSRREP